MKTNYSDEPVLKNEKSIFLAGPTPREANVLTWRKEACNKLENMGFDGIVYVPEYSTWKPKESYIDQANWEREAMTEATVILFWIPRVIDSAPGFTTNVEFGYWLHSHKVTYGRPDNTKKTKYLDWLFREDYKEEPFSFLDDLLKHSVMKANQNFKK